MEGLEGKNLGRYSVLERIGRGGMATVYTAFDARLERIVAVKVLLRDDGRGDEFLMRFQREAKTLALLSHPNIVKVLDYGEQDGLPFLILDYIQGGSMATRVEKPMDWATAAALLAPVADALQYAHSHGVIHRDVKPSNILLSEIGQPMLSDFGIAKLLQYSTTLEVTLTGEGIGTPDYMAPEQYLGTGSDHRVDIYALGMVYYELVTGVRPFTADTPLSILVKQASQPLPPPSQFNPALPEDVERFIYKMLAKDPNDRYQNMAEVALAFEKIGQRNRLSQVEAPYIPAKTRPSRGSRPGWFTPVMALGGLLLVVLGVIAFFLLRDFQTPKMITITGGAGASQPVEFGTLASVFGNVQVIGSNGVATPVGKGTRLFVGAPFRLWVGDGQARFNLTDGMTICLHPNTEVEFLNVNDRQPGLPKFNLNLYAGKLLFVDDEDHAALFTLLKPTPVNVSGQGAVIGMEKTDADTVRIALDCLAGNCSFESPVTRTDLASTGRLWLDSTGIFSPPEQPRNENWLDVCGDLVRARVPGLAAPVIAGAAPVTTQPPLSDLLEGLFFPNTPPPTATEDQPTLAPVIPTAQPTNTSAPEPTDTQPPPPPAIVPTLEITAPPPTSTSTQAATDLPTGTPSPVSTSPTPNATSEPTVSQTQTGTPNTSTPTATNSLPTPTGTPTPTATSTMTNTPAPTDTPSLTPTATDTPIPIPTPTPTVTATQSTVRLTSVPATLPPGSPTSTPTASSTLPSQVTGSPTSSPVTPSQVAGRPTGTSVPPSQVASSQTGSPVPSNSPIPPARWVPHTQVAGNPTSPSPSPSSTTQPQSDRPSGDRSML